MPAATLLAGLVDYAGLFPPAALTMPQAVTGYAVELQGGDAWMLGRFVCPAARLEELAAAASAHWTIGTDVWRVSALAPEPDADLPTIRAFNVRHGANALADAVEGKASTVEQVDHLASLLGDLPGYVELPLEPDPAPLLASCARLGLRAKARLGGVVADAIPRPELVARFLRRCHEAGVPFKATAGLHHAVRGAHPLTYAPDAPRATMHGFLNLLVATHLAGAGADDADVCAALEERDPAAFVLQADAFVWRHHALPRPAIVQLRATLIAVGSCSFREPMRDLTTLGLT